MISIGYNYDGYIFSAYAVYACGYAIEELATSRHPNTHTHTPNVFCSYDLWEKEWNEIEKKKIGLLSISKIEMHAWFWP